MHRRLPLLPACLAGLLALTLALLPSAAPTLERRPGDRPAEGSGADLPASDVPQLRDVTAAAGLSAVNICGDADRKDYIFEAKGGGVGAFDYDNDGWMDILLVQGS